MQYFCNAWQAEFQQLLYVHAACRYSDHIQSVCNFVQHLYVRGVCGYEISMEHY